MAITWVANSAKAYAGGQLTVTKPAGVQNDDLIVLITVHDDASDHTSGWQPTGFTEIADSPWTWNGTDDPGSDSGAAVAIKTASSEPSTWAFNATNTHNNEQQAAFAIILRGCDNGDPIDVTAKVDIDRTDTTRYWPGVTVSNDDSFLICFSGTGHNTLADRWVSAAGYPDMDVSMSNNFETDYTTDTYVSLIGASGAFDSGATGDISWAIDSLPSEDPRNITLAFNPAGAASGRRIFVTA